MMQIASIRSDLGHHVFELVCECSPDRVFIVNLDADLPTYNPVTGKARCPRCGETALRENILLQAERKPVPQEARENWQPKNPETGEAI